MEKILRDKSASNEILLDFKEVNDLSIKNWLINKNIIDKESYVIKYEDLVSWVRGGGETFITQFAINYTNNEGILFNKRIVIKALVSVPIERNLLNWKSRRSFLQENKINVSNWYWCDNGTIIEDYYPKDYTFCELSKLIDIAIKLDKLGFNTTNFLNDIRCNQDNDPFYVDFGFDLGEPSKKATNTSYQKLLSRFGEKVAFIKNYSRINYLC